MDDSNRLNRLKSLQLYYIYKGCNVINLYYISYSLFSGQNIYIFSKYYLLFYGNLVVPWLKTKGILKTDVYVCLRDWGISELLHNLKLKLCILSKGNAIIDTQLLVLACILSNQNTLLLWKINSSEIIWSIQHIFQIFANIFFHFSFFSS